MVTVTLTAAERQLARQVADQRHRDAMAAGRRPSHGCSLWDAPLCHRLGAKGELAAAKALGIAWDGTATLGDVGPYQVRATTHPGGHLLLHDWDRPDAPFILVLAALDGATFTLRGWLWGDEGQDVLYWRDGYRPCYFVPQRALRPMRTLPAAAQVGEKAKGGDGCTGFLS